jgi:hypothetical protein
LRHVVWRAIKAVARDIDFTSIKPFHPEGGWELYATSQTTLIISAFPPKSSGSALADHKFVDIPGQDL